MENNSEAAYSVVKNNNRAVMFVFEEDFKQGVHMASSSIDGPLIVKRKLFVLEITLVTFSLRIGYMSYGDKPY